MNEQDYEQLTLFQGASPASHLVLPGSEKAVKMTVTSGLKCCGLSKTSGPLGSLVRMLLASSQWHSTRCYLTWRPSATPASRLLFRLVPSPPRTGGIEFSSWPTQTAADVYTDKLKSSQQKGEGRHSLTLGRAVQMWPTPIASDWKNRGCRDYRKNREYQLQTSVGGQLNPDWVCAMMGFPPGWLNVEEDGQMEHGKKEYQGR